MTNIASRDQEIVNSLIGNNNGKINSNFITFYKTFGGLGLLISKAQPGAYVAIAKDGSSSIPKSNLKLPFSRSNCTGLNKWHIISVAWSNKGENLSNCWYDGEKLRTFTMGNIKGSNYCYLGDLGIMSGSNKTQLTGCIGEIISLHGRLTSEENLYIHEYLMKKWRITDTIIS